MRVGRRLLHQRSERKHIFVEVRHLRAQGCAFRLYLRYARTTRMRLAQLDRVAPAREPPTHCGLNLSCRARACAQGRDALARYVSAPSALYNACENRNALQVFSKIALYYTVEFSREIPTGKEREKRVEGGRGRKGEKERGRREKEKEIAK